MVKFVAYDQVELNHLLELGTLADTGPAQISQRSPSGFHVKQGNVDFHLTGHNITYVGGVPWNGTLNTLLVKVDGQNAYGFANFSFSVQQAWNILGLDDPMQAVARILPGNDTIIGSLFDDTLYGFTGNDIINGRGGGDHLFGGSGNDLLTGAAGRDIQNGGPGRDRFDFNAAFDSVAGADRDTILGFSHPQGDRIDLRTIDANSNLGGNQAFHFVGAFTNHAGELRVNGQLAQMDLNGDGVADMEIRVTGSALHAIDFYL